MMAVPDYWRRRTDAREDPPPGLLPVYSHYQDRNITQDYAPKRRLERVKSTITNVGLRTKDDDVSKAERRDTDGLTLNQRRTRLWDWAQDLYTGAGVRVYWLTARVTVWATVQVVGVVMVVTQGSSAGREGQHAQQTRARTPDDEECVLLMKLCSTLVAVNVSVVK